jgi:hypothetical protein
VAFAVAVGADARALAQRTQSAPANVPSGEVMVLHATQNDAGAIDPRIRRLPLNRPPFSSFNTYKLIGLRLEPLQPN